MPQRIRLPEQNQVILVGRAAQDPDLKYTQKGQGICRFNLAINRSYKDANGEWQKEVNYIPIVAWRDVAVRCSERLKKGSPVYITGRLRSHTWDDKAGQKHKSIEVEVIRIQYLEVKGDEQEAETTQETADEGTHEEVNTPKADEEVPF